eukprot:5140442-Lingulodinium_polyedra.AAC.1
MQSNRRFAIAAARKSHVCSFHARVGSRSAGGARAGVRFASRCDGETSMRPRHCAAFSKRSATM